jgi:hypothetical protein
MPQQQIKFTIRQDGLVSEEVLGVVGDACQDLTKSIEEKLGECYLHRNQTRILSTRKCHTSAQ